MKTAITSVGTQPGLIARIDAWFQRRRMRSVEAWLATSENLYELEARMRELDRANSDLDL